MHCENWLSEAFCNPDYDREQALTAGEAMPYDGVAADCPIPWDVKQGGGGTHTEHFIYISTPQLSSITIYKLQATFSKQQPAFLSCVCVCVVYGCVLSYHNHI